MSKPMTHEQTVFLLRTVPQYKRPLRIEEAARMMGISEKSLRNMIYKNPAFPVIKVGKARQMVRLEDLRDWLHNTPEGSRYWRRYHERMSPALMEGYRWE